VIGFVLLNKHYKEHNNITLNDIIDRIASSNKLQTSIDFIAQFCGLVILHYGHQIN